MSYRKLLCILIPIVFCTTVFVACQNRSPHKVKDEYQSLANKFYDHQDSLNIAFDYAKKYLLKAKNDKDTAKIANGYYFLSLASSTGELSHTYNDSIILVVKNHGSEHFPTLAYQKKATKFYNQGDFKKAFDYYLKANDEAKKYHNELYYHQSIRDMVLLKAHVGEHETGLEALRKCHEYFSKSIKRRPLDYLTTLFALSDSYIHHKKLDSASIINKLGYTNSKLYNNVGLGDGFYFTFNEGINQYYKENYKAAEDSLRKSMAGLEYFGDLANQGMAHFYLGKTLAAMSHHHEAIEEHKKVDRILQKSPQMIPQSRESYDILINHYKKLGDKDNQLKYIQRFTAADSILNSDYKYLIKNVIQNYDIPKLISEKQEIIDSLEDDKKSSTLMNSILVVLTLTFFGFWIYNYLKRKTYKKRFNELYNKTNSIQIRNRKPLDKDESNTIGVSEDIIKDILDKLDKFEQNLDFLKSDITTSTLSKTFNTNYKYLSKVVNTYKKKSFSTYINDLRIDYSVVKLKEDQKFQNYTMKAIAQEIGFNTTQAFSKSFYKKNGIHPSYFIKQLEKQQYL